MPQRTCSPSSLGVALKDVHARRGLTKDLTADFIANELRQQLGNMRRPVTVAAANRLRAEEQTDSEALIPVAVVGPPPVAIRRSAVPGGIVPGATTDHAFCVPACPPAPEQLNRPAGSGHRITPFAASSRHPRSEREQKGKYTGIGIRVRRYVPHEIAAAKSVVFHVIDVAPVGPDGSDQIAAICDPVKQIADSFHAGFSSLGTENVVTNVARNAPAYLSVLALPTPSIFSIPATVVHFS